MASQPDTLLRLALPPGVGEGHPETAAPPSASGAGVLPQGELRPDPPTGGSCARGAHVRRLAVPLDSVPLPAAGFRISPRRAAGCGLLGAVFAGTSPRHCACRQKRGARPARRAGRGGAGMLPEGKGGGEDLPHPQGAAPPGPRSGAPPAPDHGLGLPSVWLRCKLAADTPPTFQGETWRNVGYPRRRGTWPQEGPGTWCDGVEVGKEGAAEGASPGARVGGAGRQAGRGTDVAQIQTPGWPRGQL